MRSLAVAALIFALSVSLAAQRAGSFHFSGFGGHSGFGHAGRSHFPGQHFGHRGDRGGDYGWGFFDPFWVDDLSPDYAPAAANPAPSQPPVVVVQSAPSAPAADTPSAPAQPLMIELQGERYVRISGDDPSQAQIIDDAGNRKTSAQPVIVALPPPSSTILVFRDGRRQEVSAYTIADGALYASTDYATTGSWTQKIELTSLNIPETMSINSSHGIPFKLPTSSNEVIVGP